jgi:hypothetical protein
VGQFRRVLAAVAAGAVALLVDGCTSSASPNSADRVVPVTLTGGFEIGANDYGRPVPLYASMLGVTPDVFRRAFSGVHPDAAHDPTSARQQDNKTALMSVLAAYHVSNDQLDRVANYYRFNSAAGQTWPDRQARAEAVVTNGTVTSIRVLDGGAGYTAAPSVVIEGLPSVTAVAHVVFTTDFATNGHIAAITLRH